MDATAAAERGDSLLVLHLVGLLITNDPSVKPAQSVAIINGDRPYGGRTKRL